MCYLASHFAQCRSSDLQAGWRSDNLTPAHSHHSHLTQHPRLGRSVANDRGGSILWAAPAPRCYVGYSEGQGVVHFAARWLLLQECLSQKRCSLAPLVCASLHMPLSLPRHAACPLLFSLSSVSFPTGACHFALRPIHTHDHLHFPGPAESPGRYLDPLFQGEVGGSTVTDNPIFTQPGAGSLRGPIVSVFCYGCLNIHHLPVMCNAYLFPLWIVPCLAFRCRTSLVSVPSFALWPDTPLPRLIHHHPPYPLQPPLNPNPPHPTLPTPAHPSPHPSLDSRPLTWHVDIAGGYQCR